MINIISKILAGITIIVATISGLFIPNNKNYYEQKITQLETRIEELEGKASLGTFYPVAAGKFRLAGSGVGSTDVTIILQSFKEPVSNLELAMTDFGDIGYGTIDPGTSKVEFISFTGVSQDASSDRATLTGVSRGLGFTYPYTASTTLASAHSGGAIFIISNPPQLYQRYANKEMTESITGIWTFDDAAWPRLDSSSAIPSSDSYFATKNYVDDTAVAGAPDATSTTKGIVEIATISEVISMKRGGEGDTTAELVVPNRFFATTTQATTSVVVAQSDGKIDQNFLDLTESFSWSGIQTFSASTTFATSTFLKPVEFASTTTLLGSITATNASSSFATTTFAGIPFTTGGNPYEANQLTRKGYVDTKIGGLSNYDATSSDTVGYATSTMQVCIYLIANAGGEIAEVFAKVGSSNPPATIITAGEVDGNTTINYGGFCILVKKGWYWLMDITLGGGGEGYVYQADFDD